MTTAPRIIPPARQSETRRRLFKRTGRSATRRNAEVAFIAERGGLVPWVDVEGALGLNTKDDGTLTSSDLVALIRAKRVFGRRIDGVYMVTTNAADLPPVDRRLPMLEAGIGERRDCHHESECLGRFVQQHPKKANGSARCPSGCSSFTPIEQHERIGAASRTESPLAAMQSHAPYGEEEES